MKKLIILFIVLFISCNKDDFIVEAKLILPIISIQTENSSNITSKDYYLNGTIEINGTNDSYNLFENLKIKGRGNSTWNYPKKPYQIKFDSKTSILGMPIDKKWILLANYSDKTMLRNQVAFDLGKFSNLDWTPESRFLELFINDEYLGVYQITQKVEESANRVNIGNNGFLLEVDQSHRLKIDDVYFNTSNYLFNIKEPKVDFNDDEFNLIKNYIELTENILLGNNFKDPINGYAKYIDVDSFIDWFLINEITKNNDAIFYSSVYLNYMPGGKLKMGPIWDFDISLGNINYNENENPEGFWIKKSIWFSRLFEDPHFVTKVKSRFNYFSKNRNVFDQNITSNQLLLINAQERNFYRWPILGTYIVPNYVYYESYDEEIIYLKKWLNDRFEWLNISINNL